MNTNQEKRLRKITRKRRRGSLLPRWVRRWCKRRRPVWPSWRGLHNKIGSDRGKPPTFSSRVAWSILKFEKKVMNNLNNFLNVNEVQNWKRWRESGIWTIGFKPLTTSSPKGGQTTLSRSKCWCKNVSKGSDEMQIHDEIANQCSTISYHGKMFLSQLKDRLMIMMSESLTRNWTLGYTKPNTHITRR